MENLLPSHFQHLLNTDHVLISEITGIRHSIVALEIAVLAGIVISSSSRAALHEVLCSPRSLIGFEWEINSYTHTITSGRNEDRVTVS